VNKIALFFFAVWSFFVVVRLALNWDANEMIFYKILSDPSTDAWLGRDDYGRSILARLIDGLINSLTIVFIVTLVASSIGIIIGVVAGYFGGKIDQLISYFINLFMSFPGILLAIAFAAILSPGKLNLIIALSIGSWVSYARLARAQTLITKNCDYVKASKTMGSNDFWILKKHILPALQTPLLVEGTYSVAGLIIAEASLSFLGLGIQAPEASLGGMMRDSVRFLLVSPHYAIFVGASIMSLVYCINATGDFLHKYWNVEIIHDR